LPLLHRVTTRLRDVSHTIAAGVANEEELRGRKSGEGDWMTENL
jgi:hypothetical protein